jgi:hypothetical protein
MGSGFKPVGESAVSGLSLLESLGVDGYNWVAIRGEGGQLLHQFMHAPLSCILGW